MTRNHRREPASVAQSARDRLVIDILHDPVQRDLGPGNDLVIVRSDATIGQIRLTLDRTEVGNGNPYNADGDLAVALQAEDLAGTPFGPISRFDDEGITFVTRSPTVKFDIRDRLTGAESGLYDMARLGTAAADRFDHRDLRGTDAYLSAGAGNDRIVAGWGNDHLVGGLGDDLLVGRGGDDLLVGGPGDDRLIGGWGNDTAVVVPAADGADRVNLGGGLDTVRVVAAPGEYRLTLTTHDIGNGNPRDGGDDAGEDGRLAIRFQAEDASGTPVGPVSRYDDEGISFVGTPGVTFQVVDLPSDFVRGEGFVLARMGTAGDDRYDERGWTGNVFVNAGAGDDRIRGGAGDDLVVGLYGDDRVAGGRGDDTVVGEEGDDWLNGGAGDDVLFPLLGADTLVFRGRPGNDTVFTYEPGTDRIDLTAYGIGLADLQVSSAGANTLVGVDTDADGNGNFTILLANSGPPAQTDYLF